MRQILFRGKTKNGEWIMGDFLHPFNIAYTKIEYDRVLHGNTEHLHIEPILTETIGQFTGLTDKHGNMIFEGDILQTVFLEGDEQHKELQTIVYLEDECKFAWRYSVNSKTLDYDLDRMSYVVTDGEIVGNIHDNPELLMLVSMKATEAICGGCLHLKRVTESPSLLYCEKSGKQLSETGYGDCWEDFDKWLENHPDAVIQGGGIDNEK